MQTKNIQKVDPQTAAILKAEEKRQETQLQMIASENYASLAVMEAQGSVMTNKYAEGYSGKRFYQGMKHYDEVEDLAIERAKKLFGAEHANVQPSSGSQANMAVYFALCQPGDTVLGMDLACGGHLTHGMPTNFSGRLFKMVGYPVHRETHRLEMEEVRRLALEHKPRMIIAGASAYPRTLDFAAFRQVADEVGAILWVDMAHIAGLVAAGVHPNPVPHADVVTTTTHKTLRGPRGGMILSKEKHAKALNSWIFPGIQGGPLMHAVAAKAVAFAEALKPAFRKYQEQVVANARGLAAALMAKGYTITTGGTDNHLMLVDLRPQGITGRDAAAALEEAGIVVNKNGVPFDVQSPFVTSGIRIGTPGVTTRGMKQKQILRIADWMDQVLSHLQDAGLKKRVAKEVAALCQKFPVYR
jgi:glycine hydroxymethyltransferase